MLVGLVQQLIGQLAKFPVKRGNNKSLSEPNMLREKIVKE